MCQYLHKALRLPKDLHVIRFLGNGIMSAVLMVRSANSFFALKITHHNTTMSKMESEVNDLLSSMWLAPRMLREFRIGVFNMQLLQPIRMTLGRALEIPVREKGRALKELAKKWSRAILSLLGELKKKKITHGDLHSDNVAIGAGDRLMLIDFDRSSTDSFVEGFDLVTLLDSLQPWRVSRDGKCINRTLLQLIARDLIKKVPKAWLKGKLPDLQKLDKFEDAWALSLTDPSVTKKHLRRILRSK